MSLRAGIRRGGAVSMIYAFLLLFVSRVWADTCASLRQYNPDVELAYPGSPDFESTLDYWSTNCAAQKPSCIVLPRDARQVAAALWYLNQINEPFAIKGGGHSPNCGYASISGGTLIALRRMDQVAYDSASQTVRVGPGNRWMNVTAALEGTGRMVVGGRIGLVGVPGLLLGGGMSFLSSQYGWAANHVLEYEIVLPNATITTASNTNNPDLFAALKGGGGNFGVVTNFVLRTFAQGQIWGGIKLYSASKTPEILDAVRTFTEEYPDPKAAIIATAELTGASLVDIWIVFHFYDGPTPPPGAFAGLEKVTPLLDLTKSRTMNDLMVFNNNFVLKNSIYTIATETTPLPNSTVGSYVMNNLYNAWHDIAKSVQAIPGAVASIAFQPVPKIYLQKAREYGGVVMDFDESTPHIIFELDYSYWYPRNDEEIDKATVATYSALGNTVRKMQSLSFLPEKRLPLFMNDAYFRQDYFGRLGNENAAALRVVRERYDPSGMFVSRTKGFHI